MNLNASPQITEFSAKEIVSGNRPYSDRIKIELVGVSMEAVILRVAAVDAAGNVLSELNPIRLTLGNSATLCDLRQMMAVKFVVQPNRSL